MQLTDHFTLSEFIYSQTALDRDLDNTPSPRIVERIAMTAAGMERIRACLGFPITITSGYRSEAVNDAVGGDDRSQHLTGDACDFVCPQFGTPLEICHFLSDKLAILGIDQLIFEGGWVHVSFSLNPRKELLSLHKGSFVKGLV